MVSATSHKEAGMRANGKTIICMDTENCSTLTVASLTRANGETTNFMETARYTPSSHNL